MNAVLHHLAQAAATILLLELLVVLLIFLAISGGLAFGFHWLNGKTEWAFGKANTYVGIGRRAIHTGTDYIALPFVKVSGFVDSTKATARALRSTVRLGRERQDVVAARPVPPALEATTASPLVDDAAPLDIP